ncbi:hypothetical protein BCR34DRAFT_581323 [Clohesyomyces aquaticus]|uniref:Phorbol-ester/DAG-type domain-containing protein n=1 Tax=Clohesyomyces aquaticus TaxID=1231657 RepID=A0A1Y1Y1M1_9PLEO|nr:hypothetical protein BCR34DRAFT_581323 [Clohesyomyces aquaticus]
MPPYLPLLTFVIFVAVILVPTSHRGNAYVPYPAAEPIPDAAWQCCGCRRRWLSRELRNVCVGCSHRYDVECCELVG